MRYNNSFSYSFIVGDKVILNKLLLPPMLIQPLIENAILHGIIGAAIPNAHIEITIQQIAQTLLITVNDNGIGLPSKITRQALDGVKEKSIGLASIEERIKLINIKRLPSLPLNKELTKEVLPQLLPYQFLKQMLQRFDESNHLILLVSQATIQTKLILKTKMLLAYFIVLFN